VLRRYFKVDAPSIVLRVLQQLAGLGEFDATAPARANAAYRLKDVVAAPVGTSEGASEWM
jgi:pyruvate dehydrogenase E1 component